MNEYDEGLEFLIPVNYDEPTNVLLGMINPSRLIQAIVCAAPVILLGVLLPFVLVVKLIIIVIGIFLFLFGLIGWRDMGLFSFFSILTNFIKQPKNFSMKRIERKENNYASSRKRPRSRQKVKETKKAAKNKKR